MAGNILVGQSGGPTAVINASLAGVVRAALASRQIAGVYGAVNGILGVLREELSDMRQEDPATLDLLRDTAGAALGTSRFKVNETHLQRILDVFKAHDVRYFCYIGGNDSMDTAHKVGRLAADNRYELYVIGVPKTVDNDLAHTDHCPGYGSAARFVAATMRDTGIDSRGGALSTPVKIVEIMGRHAGWLTAAAALAREGLPDGAPHLIYVPERPISLEAFLTDVEREVRRRGYVVVALSEGVRDPSGEWLGAISRAKDAFGHRQLGGVSALLAEQVTQQLGLKARFEKPDTMQRSSASIVSQVDRQEAYRVGQAAVDALLKGTSDRMITLERAPGPAYACHTGLVDLSLVAGVERLLPDAYIAEHGRDVTPAFVGYARPLIGSPLPAAAILTGHRVSRRLPTWDA
jgi:ATP-dependent phosphofructokinase / diphosphate-dependent phosphofructokinase